MCWSLWCLEQERGGKLEVVRSACCSNSTDKRDVFFYTNPNGKCFLLATYCEFTYFLRIIFLKDYYMRNILQINMAFSKRIIFFSLII